MIITYQANFRAVGLRTAMYRTCTNLCRVPLVLETWLCRPRRQMPLIDYSNGSGQMNLPVHLLAKGLWEKGYSDVKPYPFPTTYSTTLDGVVYPNVVSWTTYEALFRSDVKVSESEVLRARYRLTKQKTRVLKPGQSCVFSSIETKPRYISRDFLMRGTQIAGFTRMFLTRVRGYGMGVNNQNWYPEGDAKTFVSEPATQLGTIDRVEHLWETYPVLAKELTYLNEPLTLNNREQTSTHNLAVINNPNFSLNATFPHMP